MADASTTANSASTDHVPGDEVPRDKLRLVLVSAEAELLDTLCDEVTLPGRQGQMGVFPGHAPFLGTLQPGVLTYRTGSQQHRVAVTGGFCEVFEGGIRVLVDSACEPTDVDAEAVREELGKARQESESVSSESPESLLAAQDRVKALEAQLEVAG